MICGCGCGFSQCCYSPCNVRCDRYRDCDRDRDDRDNFNFFNTTGLLPFNQGFGSSLALSLAGVNGGPTTLFRGTTLQADPSQLYGLPFVRDPYVSQTLLAVGAQGVQGVQGAQNPTQNTNPGKK